jgi:hypothetical protein
VFKAARVFQVRQAHLVPKVNQALQVGKVTRVEQVYRTSQVVMERQAHQGHKAYPVRQVSVRIPIYRPRSLLYRPRELRS